MGESGSEDGMDDDRNSFRRMYGPMLLVVVTFTLTLALGVWFYVMREPSEGMFSSPAGVVTFALGAALGQVIAALLARRHLRR
jgi:hypothetical protein